MKDGLITPPKHVSFEAKKLFENVGQIIDGSIAYIGVSGGGPTEQHTHAHDHLFVVVKGEARIQLGEEAVVIRKDEAFLVKGTIPHSVWNNQDDETVMLGITVMPHREQNAAIANSGV